MRLHLIAAACAALLPLAPSSALAAQPLTARLAQPLTARTTLVAGGAAFVCEADACVAASPASRTFSPATCKVIAGKVGPVLAFGAARPMDARGLADCNARAGADPAAQVARR